MEPLVGGDGTDFDASKFNWIGSITNEVSIITITDTVATIGRGPRPG